MRQVHTRTPRPRAIVGMSHPVRRAAIVRALRADGWVVAPAEDGYQLIGRIAVAVLDEGEPRPDLIIADATMHGCMGTTVLQGLRELQWSTPFILISDFGRAWEQQVLALQPSAVFEKPVDVAEVRAAVAAFKPVSAGPKKHRPRRLAQAHH